MIQGISIILSESTHSFTFILCMHMKSTFSYVSHHHNNLLAQTCCSSNHNDFHKYFVWPISSLQECEYFFDILKIRNMFLNY